MLQHSNIPFKNNFSKFDLNVDYNSLKVDLLPYQMKSVSRAKMVIIDLIKTNQKGFNPLRVEILYQFINPQ